MYDYAHLRATERHLPYGITQAGKQRQTKAIPRKWWWWCINNFKAHKMQTVKL